MKTTKKIILATALAAAVFLALNVPVTTKQGVNFVVVAKKIPLYVKICGFLYRDYQYKDLSRNIVRGIRDDSERVEAVYRWTVENIKRSPAGLPVVDDHIWNIVVRGYGTADQMADVFTTLANYSGYEAFWLMPDAGDGQGPILSFVMINDKWSIFDIYNTEYFIDSKYPRKTPGGASLKRYQKETDSELFRHCIRRADKQRVGPRLIYELKKRVSGS